MRRTQTRPRSLHELSNWRLPAKGDDASDRRVAGVTDDLLSRRTRSLLTTNARLRQDSGNSQQGDDSSVVLPNYRYKSSIVQVTFDTADERSNQIEWPMLTEEPQKPGRTNLVSCWQRAKTVKAIKDELTEMRRDHHGMMDR